MRYTNRALAVGVVSAIIAGCGGGKPQATDGPPVDPNSYEGIVHLVKANGIRRIADLLPRLPRSLRSRFTYVYRRPFPRRHGVHEASFQAPRAIAFGDTAELIVTFNGEPGQEAYGLLELAQFRRETSRIELRAISFPEDGPGEVTFSEPNPAECMGCHATRGFREPRYLWSEYRDWEGVYGSHDDELPEGSLERAEFLAFSARAKAHPRYRHLEAPPDEGDGLTPYSRLATDYRYRPNLVLTKLLDRLTVKRSLALVEASPAFPRYRGALALAAQGCVPNGPKSRERFERLSRALGLDEAGADWRFRARPAVFAALGSNQKDWVLDFRVTRSPDGPGGFAYEDGSGSSMSHLASRLIDELVPRNARLGSLRRVLRLSTRYAHDVANLPLLGTFDALGTVEEYVDARHAAAVCEELEREAIGTL